MLNVLPAPVPIAFPTAPLSFLPLRHLQCRFNVVTSPRFPNPPPNPFAAQMVLFVCCAYFALHSAVLTLIALVYKDPLALFQRYSPGAYVMLQFLSLLAYVIFLALCIVSFLTAVRTGELVQRGLGAGQLVPAIGVGVHYFGAVWQPAMVVRDSDS